MDGTVLQTCTSDVFERLSQVGSLLGGVGAILALVLTCLVYFGQRRLSKQFQSDEKNLHEEQQRFSQRQLLIPLWENLRTLRDVDPVKPVWPDVVEAINKLELVALLVEGGVIERDVFIRAFGRVFLGLCGKISEVGLGPDKKTGAQLIDEAPALALLFDELRAEERKRGKLSPFNLKETA